MTSIVKDPLLAIAKGVLWFLMGVMALGAAACLLAAPFVIAFQDRIIIEVAKEVPQLPGGDFIGALLLILLCVAALLGVLCYIFLLLKRIVDSVADGDPFVPANAQRLTRMAWLTLGVQLLTLPIEGMAMWIDSITEHAQDAHDASLSVSTGLDGNGLLLVLILFILARVFREGTRLRDEVEGTV